MAAQAGIDVPAQWGFNRVPFGSDKSVFRSVAPTPRSVKWLLVGPSFAGSLLIQQKSVRSARMFFSRTLFVSGSSQLAFPPTESHRPHTTATVTQQTYATSAAKCKVRTDPAQSVCAASSVPQKPSQTCQHVFCRPKSKKCAPG